jgi:hypothetical protein
MNSQLSVPIPADLYVRFEDFLRAEGKPGDPLETIAQAVDNWIKQVQARPLTVPPRAAAAPLPLAPRAAAASLPPPADAEPWSDDWIMFGAPPPA